MEASESKFDEDRRKLCELEANRDVLRKKLQIHVQDEKAAREEFDKKVKVLAAAKLQLDSISHFGFKKIAAKITRSYADTYDEFSRQETMAQIELNEAKYKIEDERKLIKQYNTEYEKALREYDSFSLYMKKMYPDETGFITEKKERAKDAYFMIKEIDEAILSVNQMLKEIQSLIEKLEKRSGFGYAIKSSVELMNQSYVGQSGINNDIISLRLLNERTNKEIKDVNDAYLAYASKYGSNRELFPVLSDGVEADSGDSQSALRIKAQCEALSKHLNDVKDRLNSDKREILRFET